MFSVGQSSLGIPPLQLADLPTVYTTTNQKSALDPAFYAKRGTQDTNDLERNTSKSGGLLALILFSIEE